MSMVLALAEWAASVHPAWAGWVFRMVLYIGVSLHSFSLEACFDKMWSGRYTCSVPYIDSDLIKSFVSIIFVCRAYLTARTTSHPVMGLVRLKEITRLFNPPL
jgi:hypothetical protein